VYFVACGTIIKNLFEKGTPMSFDMKKSLFLIDGSSFLYRAYYGLQPLHTADGKPVQAVYGFCRMIKNLVEKFAPQNMVLVWDSKGKTKRHEIYEAYKATRQAPPSDLFEQKELIQEFAQLIGLHQFSQTGVEADDLMYSLGLWWQGQGGTVVVVTSDKDMGQMLSESVMIYDSFKNIFINETAFQEKMGFPVKKTAFYFALLGDSSDNIPGVKGIGEKRALELVNQFDSLEAIYKDIHRVAQPGVRRSLEGHKDDAFLSERLFTLHTYPITSTEKDVAFDYAGWVNARPLFEKLNFKSLLKDMPTASATISAVRSSQDKGYRFELVTTPAQLAAVIKEINNAGMFAYDTEGDGLNPLLMNIMGISVCTQEGVSYYIPCGHVTHEKQLSREELIAAFKPVFEDEAIKKIAHHAKFDQLVLYQNGIREKGLVFDTIIAAALVKEEWQKNSLKELSAHYLQEPMHSFESVVFDQKYKDFSQVPLDKATEYAAADAHQTFKLYTPLQKMLQEKNANFLYYEIELPLVEVLFEMEAHGIQCERAVLHTLHETVERKLGELYRTITGLIDPRYASINLNSPKQVAELLFEYLQLPTQKKSAKRTGYATDYEVLLELSKIHPIPSFLMQYRELSKLKNTYLEALPNYINPRTGRIHTTYSQTRVATGRLASSDPNLQNIPAEGLGSMVRSAFYPQEGHLFLSADYSQIELRILAHLSQDENLMHAFKSGNDIHAETASALLGIPASELTTHDRNIGKRINFSILYGLTPYGLSKDMDISLKDAKKYIDVYFERYPKVKEWMDTVIENTKRLGYTETVFGRRRPVPGMRERNKHLYEEACRIAINTVAQGTAAEIMKIGMLRLSAALKKSGYDAALVLQIHDELLLTVAQSQIDAVQKMVVQELENVVEWEIPLTVNVAVGKNWKEVS
jgi:DNA polymerase-1